MTKSIYIALALLLSACGGGGTSKPPADAGPSDTLAEINHAYQDNAVQAQRAWGGKRVVVGGAFDSAGKIPDGTISVLLNPGPGAGLGVLDFDAKHADFIAGLKKDQEVTADCTVDPKHEGIAGGQFLDCKPGSVKAS